MTRVHQTTNQQVMICRKRRLTLRPDNILTPFLTVSQLARAGPNLNPRFGSFCDANREGFSAKKSNGQDRDFLGLDMTQQYRYY